MPTFVWQNEETTNWYILLELKMGISVTKLLIVLAIIIVIFGSKRLRTLGTDLGDAIKSFRSAVKDGEEDKTGDEVENSDNGKLLQKS
jgi:sec-independent protein translocase protein TatA